MRKDFKIGRFRLQGGPANRMDGGVSRPGGLETGFEMKFPPDFGRNYPSLRPESQEMPDQGANKEATHDFMRFTGGGSKDRPNLTKKDDSRMDFPAKPVDR